MPTARNRYSGPKSQSVNGIITRRDSPAAPNDSPQSKGAIVKFSTPILPTIGLATRHQVDNALSLLLAKCQSSDAANALVPWFCDALPSVRSRREYFRDIQSFFLHMQRLGVHPYDVTGDHVRIYKESAVQAGMRPASVARALSVIRGTYEQFGKKGLVAWNIVGDIQAVTAPRVTKNTTPMIGEDDACKMLHAPDNDTPLGCRDHALLFVYFKTACRSRAIAGTTIGDLERSDTEWFLRVTEKGNKERRLPLLEAAQAVLRWLEFARLSIDAKDSPLFPAIDRDHKTPTMRHLSGRQILNIVKKYAREVGLNTDPTNRRGICTHSLRKTSAVNALQHGAPVHQVQQWLGHADIRTTQEYISYKDDDIEAAARRCQIR
jgi:site-specific recombinase XerD